jgi:hypothetical protein
VYVGWELFCLGKTGGRNVVTNPHAALRMIIQIRVSDIC